MTRTPLTQLLDLAPKTKATIALAEGAEPRTLAAALRIRALDLAHIILVGPQDEIEKGLAQAGATAGTGLSIHDPNTSALRCEITEAFYQRRHGKGITREEAAAQIRNPLNYAATLVHLGHADGTVAGAISPTADVIRPALQIIGKAPDAALVSSFFLMLPPAGASADQRAMIYADCGFIVDPTAQELADIAAASATTARALLEAPPAVAMLSFSTAGSARHVKVDKVIEATEILRQSQPDLALEGELQFDAAFVPETAARKAPGSPVAGHANVMVFPSLNAGNLAYKITERIGGYTAIGPVMQGLARPANDLSRGCSVEDIVQIIAITILQSRSSTSR